MREGMVQVRENRKSSLITRRWIVVSIMSTLVILLIASAAIIFSLRQSYYSSARQTIEWRVRSTMKLIPTSSSMTNQEKISTLRSLVEDFNEKDKFELMLIDDEGKILITSSGFSSQNGETLDDYYLAIKEPDGQASYTGFSVNNEHIIAVTQLLVNPIGDAEAIRFVSSLHGIDNQLIKTSEIIFVVDIVIMLFTAFSGFYFIRSIVIPIGEIGETASKISGGNYDVRIDNTYDGEIGELCEIINNMASGLSETTRMKSEFISSVSHELRTPLTSIKGWAETLASIGAEDTENFDKGMRIIMNETDRLSILVEDLLDFSRLQSSAIKINKTQLNLIQELNEAIQIVEQRALRMNITFVFEPPYETIDILADKNRMRQVFANIFDNAIKYSSPGGKISVSVRVENGIVYVATEDMGLGIPSSDIELITTRFFKASNSLTGSGIGLAVVKEIVSIHGGDIKFESTLGLGTTVTVSLPVAGEPIAKQADGVQESN
ncbi:MAG: HAMP domain-containing sensor histidine kinase [Oscillospiraceae bacterium]